MFYEYDFCHNTGNTSFRAGQLVECPNGVKFQRAWMSTSPTAAPFTARVVRVNADGSQTHLRNCRDPLNGDPIVDAVVGQGFVDFDCK
jgi:hypothetical protein